MSVITILNQQRQSSVNLAQPNYIIIRGICAARRLCRSDTHLSLSIEIWKNQIDKIFANTKNITRTATVINKSDATDNRSERPRRHAVNARCRQRELRVSETTTGQCLKIISPGRRRASKVIVRVQLQLQKQQQIYLEMSVVVRRRIIARITRRCLG